MATGVNIPPIFRWPTPWLWGGILGIVVLSADRFWEAIGGVLVTVVVASAVYLFGGREAPAARGLVLRDRVGSDDPSVEERLNEIERRLTDTQDIMIALSEKMDRWEDEAREPQTAKREAAAAEHGAGAKEPLS